MKRIVIGSCGGLTGYYLAKQFRSSLGSEWELWGLDASEAFATAHYLGKFVKCPKTANKEAFIDFLIHLFLSEEIDYYLPTHSSETRIVSEYEQRIRNSCNTKFIISPFSTYQALDNKRICAQSLRQIGLTVPQIYQDMNEVVFPAFIKPEIGSGSKNAFVIHDKNELEPYKDKSHSVLIMQYITGNEYTVDAVFGNKGELITYNQRIRLRQQGGATVYSKNDYTVDIYHDLVNISKHYTCKGVINVQFFLDGNTVYYTDVNLRYASGGLPLSVASGIDLSTLLIELMDDRAIDSARYQSDRKIRVMHRFYDERFSVL